MNIKIYHLLFDHWQRKCIAFLLAVAIWFMGTQSMMTSRVVDNIPVRVVNLPEGTTIKGLLPGNFLAHRITLSLQGNRDRLRDLSYRDLEVVLDAQACLPSPQLGERTVPITLRNLVSLNPQYDLPKTIRKVGGQSITLFFYESSRHEP